MSPLQSLNFRPNIQETGEEKAIIVFDSVIYVIAIMLVGICAFETVRVP